MERQMVQCEDGRRRQARIHGVPKEEGDFRIWKAGVRLKGKHVNGEAWYSYKTKTWYFLSDPSGKHGHLMERLNRQLREDAVNKLQEQLKGLESRHIIEQRKIAEHQAAKELVESEIEGIKKKIAQLKSGVPVEPEKPLQYSRQIKR
jgi:hypothetical protein